jgi:hypothetical protein
MCSTSHAGPAVRACVRACVLGQGANWVAGPPPAPLLELAPFVLLRFLVCGVFEAYPPLGTTPGVPGGGGAAGGWLAAAAAVRETYTNLLDALGGHGLLRGTQLFSSNYQNRRA